MSSPTDVASTTVTETGTATTSKYLKGADYYALPADEQEQCRNSMTPIAGLIRDEWVEVTKKGEIVIYSSSVLVCGAGGKTLTFLENSRENACAILLDQQKGRKNYLYLGEIKGAGQGDFDYRFLQNVYISSILQLNLAQNMKTVYFGAFTHGDYLDDALLTAYTGTYPESVLKDQNGAAAKKIYASSNVSNSDVEKARLNKIKPVRFYLWCITTPLEEVQIYADKLVTAALPWTSPKTGTAYTTLDDIRKNHSDFFTCLASTNPDAPAGFELDIVGNPDAATYTNSLTGENVPIMDLYFPKSSQRVRNALAKKGAAGTGASEIDGAIGEGAGMSKQEKTVAAGVVVVIVAALMYYFMSHKAGKASFGSHRYHPRRSPLFF